MIHRSVLTEANSVTESRTAMMEPMRKKLAVSIVSIDEFKVSFLCHLTFVTPEEFSET